MATQRFYLAGEAEDQPIELDISGASDLATLKLQIAGEFHILQQDGNGS